FRHVDAGFDAEAVEQINDVFACDIARRALRVWAAAESRNRAVERRNADSKSRVDVGKRLPVRIVKMPGERADWHFGRHLPEERLRLPGRPGADRVAARHLVSTHPMERRSDARHGGRIDVALVRATEHDRDVAANADARGV